MKNAGLAYLNLVRSPRQQGFGGREEDGVLVVSDDPLGATPLLPWKTAAVVAEDGAVHRGYLHDGRNHQVEGENGLASHEDGSSGGGGVCPPLYGRDGAAGPGGPKVINSVPSNPALEVKATSRAESGKRHSSSRGTGIKSRAVGGWRNEASLRFMLMWKQFLEHEGALLDSQYGTVRNIYEQLVDRFGVGEPTLSR